VADDLNDEIREAAEGPKRAKRDGQEAESHDLDQLIKADQYLRATSAGSGTNANGGEKSGWGMLRPARGVPPGATGDC
jgi:hypothetical protein